MRAPLAVVVVAALGLAAPAAAQGRREHLEIAPGLQWFGAMAFPPVNATQAAPGGVRRVVFRTESALASSAGVSVRVGVPVSRAIAFESTLSLHATTLSTTVRADSEGAASITATEPVTQYLFEGGVIVRPARWRHARFEPFVSAGAGYLRQLNEGQTLVETGRSWYAGGGTHYLLRRGGSGRIKSSGLRLDLRVSVLDGGVALDDGRHAVPVAGGSVFLRF